MIGTPRLLLGTMFHIDGGLDTAIDEKMGMVRPGAQASNLVLKLRPKNSCSEDLDAMKSRRFEDCYGLLFSRGPQPFQMAFSRNVISVLGG